MVDISEGVMGGQIVWSNALTYYLTQQEGCPFDGFRSECWCASTLDLPGRFEEEPTMVDAPWYDPDLPDLSSRFYGLFVFEVAGLSDTYRDVQITEGVDDGAWIGRTRRTAREVRVTGMLVAKGKDALDYGMAWLSAVLDGDRCGQHQEACGVTDVQWLTDCPPARGSVPGFTEWVDVATNVFTNPSLEAGDGTVEVRRNLSSNPNATSSGAGFSNNNGAVWTLTKGMAITDHPQGITTAVESRVADGASSSSVMSSYSVDTLGNGEKSVARIVGAWVWVNEPGYRATLRTEEGYIPIPANTWMWIAQRVDAGEYAGAIISTVSGANASATARGRVTGVTAYAGMEAPTATVAGGVPYPSAESPDPDLTASWTGTENASASILSGIVPAGVTATGCTVIQSSQWAAGGGYSARVMNVTDGATITLDSTVTDGTLMYTERDAEGLTEDVRVPFSGAPTIIPPVGVETWYDNIGIFEGDYQGPYFDGDTAGDDLNQYVWNEDGTSTYSTREAIEVPWTDEQYAEVVDPYWRYLHGVACTSGPLEKRRSSREGWEMMDVEFTLTAGRPWVYTRTRYPDLPTTSSTVIEDITHNLVPYTSAEIAGEGTVVVATNYSTNPSVETNATGWNAGGDGTSITDAQVTSGRVTGELSTNGTASFRAVWTATTAGADGEVRIWQDVDITSRPEGAPVSLNLWCATVVTGGLPVQDDLTVQAVWLDGGGAELGRFDVGTFPPEGGAATAASTVPPAETATVRLLATAPVTSWDATSSIRMYADTCLVSVP